MTSKRQQRRKQSKAQQQRSILNACLKTEKRNKLKHSKLNLIPMSKRIPNSQKQMVTKFNVYFQMLSNWLEILKIKKEDGKDLTKQSAKSRKTLKPSMSLKKRRGMKKGIRIDSKTWMRCTHSFKIDLSTLPPRFENSTTTTLAVI